MYVVILANTPTEASAYAASKGLRPAQYRYAARASSVKGLRVAEVHELPSFAHRFDKHAINAALRYTRGERIVVSAEGWTHSPGRIHAPGVAVEKPPVDQGDGMGEQLDIFDALEQMAQTLKDAGVDHPEVNAILEHGADDEIVVEKEPEPKPAAKPKRKSKSKAEPEPVERLDFAEHQPKAGEFVF